MQHIKMSSLHVAFSQGSQNTRTRMIDKIKRLDYA